jgi:hypothetical protein
MVNVLNDDEKAVMVEDANLAKLQQDLVSL